LDKKWISIEGHTSNDEHIAFKNHLPHYEKGGPSNQNNGADKANYNNV